MKLSSVESSNSVSKTVFRHKTFFNSIQPDVRFKETIVDYENVDFSFPRVVGDTQATTALASDTQEVLVR